MKLWPIILASLFLDISAMATDQAYHFNAYVFDLQDIYRSVGEGDGNPRVCSQLFAPPHTYDGRYIPIGTNATVFGVVAVTDGKTTKVIPLFKWTDELGKSHYGCNGPTPWYARWEDTQDALLATIVDAIKRK